MSNASTTPTDEEMVQVVYAYATEQLKDGTPEFAVQRDLVNKGLDHRAAAIVVDNLRSVRPSARGGRREDGVKNMTYGALWCIGGLAVTAIGYMAASSNGGGRYVVTYGAIVVGAIQFLQGVVQVISGD